MSRKPDYTGWATRTGIKCTDGRTILENAFAEDDGRTVPLVWQHMHNDPDYVLGHAVLHNTKGGVKADLFFNASSNGRKTKDLVRSRGLRESND